MHLMAMAASPEVPSSLAFNLGQIDQMQGGAGGAYPMQYPHAGYIDSSMSGMSGSRKSINSMSRPPSVPNAIHSGGTYPQRGGTTTDGSMSN